MEPKQLFKQMIDFNKSAFATGFDAMVMFQEQTETMGNLFMEKAPLLPEEGKKAVQDWISACKKGRDDFRTAVDESFNKMESFVAEANQS
jgi:hypothetical protein